MKDLHLTPDINKRNEKREIREIERVKGKIYQDFSQQRDYSKYESGQKDDLIRCPVCWKDQPLEISRCSCGFYFDHKKPDLNLWKKDEWLEEHYRFLRLQGGAIFDDHMRVCLEHYYNEYYLSLPLQWKKKHNSFHNG